MDEEKINYLRKINMFFEKYPDFYSLVKDKINGERETEVLALYNNYIIKLQKEV